MFKTQVEPRATGSWFHSQVLDILWRYFMVYKKTAANLFFTITWKKYERNWQFFFVEKACVTSDVIFIVCTFIDNSYEPISAPEFEQLL